MPDPIAPASVQGLPVRDVPAGPRRRATAVTGLLLAALLAAACTGAPADPPDDRAGGAREAVEYRPGREATVERPAERPTSVVVLVPGGGWTTADPGGMRPLAQMLLDDGHAVVTITYGVERTGDAYPVPLLDVACAVAFAAAEVPDLPVVLVGHSAGAHLVALAGLSPVVNQPVAEVASSPADADCPSPAASADAVVGLAGPYDIAATGGAADALLGVPLAQDRGRWTEANPTTWVSERTDVPFLLIHGDADDVVPLWFSEDLAEALDGAGHEVELVVLPGVDHIAVYQPEALEEPLLGWLAATLPTLGGD